MRPLELTPEEITIIVEGLAMAEAKALQLLADLRKAGFHELAKEDSEPFKKYMEIGRILERMTFENTP